MKLFFLIGLVPIAASSQMRSNLYSNKKAVIAEAVEKEVPKSEIKETVAARKFVRKHGPPNVAGGNLPSELRNRGSYAAEESPIVLPTNKLPLRLKDIQLGEVIKAEIKESLIAFNESKAPLRAVISRGNLKGTILVGEASLERNSKRIFIEFKKLRSVNSNQTWSVQAYALDEKGILGLEGRLFSNEGKYFAGELAAAGAAGYADATIKRETNSHGNSVEVPSLDTISKKALSAALSRTADRYAEKLKNVPEYSVLEGPIEIQVLITDQPKQE